MTGTKKIVLAVALISVLAVTIAMKLIFFPSVTDAWFQFNPENLRQVPGGLVIVRVTHFSKSLHKGVIMAGVNGERRMLGRNLTLQQLMAAAYNDNPARVAVSPDAPTNHFDFLVTVPSKPDEHLQLAVRKKFGFTVHPERRDVDVLVLKIVDASLTGLTVSADGEKRNVIFENRKINFQHMPLTVITGSLERMLDTPVVDRLRLTNFYDFSMAWDERTQRQMRNDTLSRDAVDKMLGAWGLGLEARTASIKMLVVEKTQN